MKTLEQGAVHLPIGIRLPAAEGAPILPAYRADIDGLRAVAVLAVVAYHALPEIMPGGFIGVDIFFVISGFLISSIIFRNLESDRFSFMDFYARRVRRIFPALALVLTATLAASWILLPTYEYRQQTGAHVAAGAGFVSNFLLWNEYGYFDASAITKPLIHLWSLGIEEQFYFVWPLLLTLAWRRKWRFLTVTGFFAAVSFGFNLLYLSRDPVGAFYAPQSRFWELMTGGLLAYSAIKRPQATALNGSVRSALGLSMIALGLLLITARSPFPGWWALLPTLGAFLVISAGPDAMPNRWLLGNRFMAGLGLISYPLYLWHWPLLCFVHIAADESPSSIVRACAVLAAGVLAWLTYALVETPIRRHRSVKAVAVIFAAIMAALLAIGIVAYERNQFNFSYDWKSSYRLDRCFIEATRPDVNTASFADTCGGIESGPRQRPLVFLWGDSHAASLYSALQFRASRQNFTLAQYNASACPPVLDYHSRQSKRCAEINQFVFARITGSRPDTVILAAYWPVYWPAKVEAPQKNEFDIATIAATVRRLHALGVKNVVVVGPLPTFNISQPAVGAMVFVENKTDRTFRHFIRSSVAIDKTLRIASTQAGAHYLSPIELLCNTEGCLISASKTVLSPLAWDYGHLTDAGAALLVDLALRSQVLRLPDQ